MPYLFGTATKVSLDASEILSCFIIHKPKFLLVAHNHPSGNPNPSNADYLVTNKIKKAGELLDVTLLDHIIIGDGQYYSFKEHDKI